MPLNQIIQSLNLEFLKYLRFVIYDSYIKYRGALCVTVIVVENGIGDSSSNPG